MPSISHYFPPFVWDLWFSNHSPLATRPQRVHIYDTYTNELTETQRPPTSHLQSIFKDLNIGFLSAETLEILQDAEAAFSRLECQAHSSVKDVLDSTIWGERWGGPVQSTPNKHTTSRPNPIPLPLSAVAALRKYFLFLRFRNSDGYQHIVQTLQESYQSTPDEGLVYPAFRPLVVQLCLRHILQEFTAFLSHDVLEGRRVRRHQEAPIVDAQLNSLHHFMDVYCWRLCDAELCFGIATEDQEFIIPDKCFGTLDERRIGNPESCTDLFFPLLPTIALYILGSAVESEAELLQTPMKPHSSVWIDVGFESAIDVHLRNACILQTYVSLLYFVSLRSIALSISSYDEFRWSGEHLDYSQLKHRCRQKFLQETVTKMLVVKGSIKVVDLTDDVVVIGDSAVAHGAFSDVWMGMWEDPVDKKVKKVALKFLRQIMVNNVRERLVKRLHAEVLAWHRLCHRNVSQLFGIFQNPTSIAMVSPWCDNGTICTYLKRNPDVNRLDLLVQVASGISYLHTVSPIIIHGDLKGGNILIDETGKPIITDFGLSKVMEEISSDLTMSGGLGTSFFAGSTRWMAPELIMALVEDNGIAPPITTFSDVYAFASICLEVVSGKLPYAHRTNDHAVTVDIIRGIRPTSSDTCLLDLSDDGKAAFWNILGQCWGENPELRPSMSDVTLFLDVLNASCVRLI